MDALQIQTEIKTMLAYVLINFSIPTKLFVKNALENVKNAQI